MENIDIEVWRKRYLDDIGQLALDVKNAAIDLADKENSEGEEAAVLELFSDIENLLDYGIKLRELVGV